VYETIPARRSKRETTFFKIIRKILLIYEYFKRDTNNFLYLKEIISSTTINIANIATRTRKRKPLEAKQSILGYLTTDLKALFLLQNDLSNIRHLFSPTGRSFSGHTADNARSAPTRNAMATRKLQQQKTTFTKHWGLAKASPTSFPLSLSQPRTLTLPSLFSDALDPNWTPTRGPWKPSKGYHLYDEATLSIRKKIQRRGIQIFDNKWIDITGEFPMFKADAISFYYMKFLKLPQTPYERRCEQLWHEQQQAEEW